MDERLAVLPEGVRVPQDDQFRTLGAEAGPVGIGQRPVEVLHPRKDCLPKTRRARDFWGGRRELQGESNLSVLEDQFPSADGEVRALPEFQRRTESGSLPRSGIDPAPEDLGRFYREPTYLTGP
jgi:hypothetical protein